MCQLAAREVMKEAGVEEVVQQYVNDPEAIEVILEYVQSLEDLLIFMCQTHEDQRKTLFELAKEGNDAIHKVPRIQGTINLIPIAQIAKVDFEQPKYSFINVRDEILKRKNMKKV